MKHKFNFVSDTITELKKQNLYRQLRYVTAKGAHITINGKRLLNFCSNDYLGLPQPRNPSGQFQSSSRLVSGNDISFKKLECLLAAHRSTQSSLVFPTGYMANLGVIPAITSSESVIFSDELNHASIIEACRLSHARTIVYRHNDIEDLSKKLHESKKSTKFIITEGIFSMDGDFSDLSRISEVAIKNDAIIILDDAHGDFVVGQNGKGTANYLGVEDKVDIHTSSLSKGLGSFGGYVASTNEVIDLCINKAKSFIYTSALPSFLVKYSIYKLKQDRQTQRKKLAKNVRFVQSGLAQIGYDVKSSTHIIPLIIGSEKKTLEVGRYLFNNGIFAQPIRYPTVPKNNARIRISVTAWLSKSHIEAAMAVFEKAAKKFKIV